MPKHLWRLMPLAGLILIAVFLYRGLSLDPRALPSMLLDKPAPTLGKANEKLKGHVWLLNVWATWCQACQQEHPVIMDLSGKGVKFVGLAYRDKQALTAEYLSQYGNPYEMNINDTDGRLAIDWGVYGAPETFIVDKKGVIRYKHVGVIDEVAWLQTLKPIIEKLEK